MKTSKLTELFFSLHFISIILVGPDGVPLPEHPLWAIWSKSYIRHEHLFTLLTKTLKMKAAYASEILAALLKIVP
jgi:hypothetical protein